MKDLRCSLLAIFRPGASPGAVVSQGEDKAVVEKFNPVGKPSNFQPVASSGNEYL